MDLKIVSGILVTTGHQGVCKVVIDLGSNSIYEPQSDLEARDLRQERIIAPRGMRNCYFDVDPCFVVSLRQLTVRDVDEFPFGSKPSVTTDHLYRINTEVNQTRMTITWRGRIEEISYLVMGTVMELEGPA